jgi:Ca2+-binding RTX toxin-like protein
VRRAVILLTAIAMAMVVGSGVALAATIHCGGGDCFGTNKHDDIFARKGGDFVSGKERADNLNGQDGNDDIFGGPGDDWVKGGRHNDTVKGNLGNDRITGGSGDNVLRAGDGMRDLIVCGANSENLIFYDPGLDHFRNCVFKERSQANNPGTSSASATARGSGSEGSAP